MQKRIVPRRAMSAGGATNGLLTLTRGLERMPQTMHLAQVLLQKAKS